MNGENRLRALAQGTVERFVACGKGELAPDVDKMRGVFYNMTRKYLGNYPDDNTRLDILTEAWINTVMQREDKVIKAFTGLNTAPSRVGQKVKAEEWIAMVVKNALINVSLQYSKQCLDLNQEDEIAPAKNPDYASAPVSRVERRDTDYEADLEQRIAETKRALETLPESKRMSRTRLNGTLKKLQAELDSLQDYSSAPQADFAEVFSLYDNEFDPSDSDYSKRLVTGMLVRLDKQTQAFFVGLYYGMTPAELQFAFGWNANPALQAIKEAVQSLAKDEGWECENFELADALSGYKLTSRDLTRVKSDTTKDELLDRYEDCLAGLTDTLGYQFKANELRQLAYNG